MNGILARATSLMREFASRLSTRRETSPVDTFEGLCRFVGARAAFVSQKKLYGYLKARMGTRYPSMFEDDAFVASVNIAKMQVFAAALSDLTVHTVALVTAGSPMGAAERNRMARACYRHGVAEHAAQPPDDGSIGEWEAAFEKRLADLHWENMSAGGDAFTESPAALYEWSPIADNLKRLDAEIVTNSIRFAWIEVVRDLRRRCDASAVRADYEATSGA